MKGKCQCPEGYGLGQNNICQPCPGGSVNPNTQKCTVGCKSDEVLLNNKCYCKAGLGYYNGQCIRCETVNGF